MKYNIPVAPIGDKDFYTVYQDDTRSIMFAESDAVKDKKYIEVFFSSAGERHRSYLVGENINVIDCGGKGREPSQKHYDIMVGIVKGMLISGVTF